MKIAIILSAMFLNYGIAHGQEEIPDSSELIAISAARPRITVHPTSVSVKEGAPASLSVTAVGDGLNYQWFNQDGPVNANGPTLSFTTTYASHRSIYSVLITNQYGVSKASRRAMVVLSERSCLARPGDASRPKHGQLSAYSYNCSQMVAQPGFHYIGLIRYRCNNGTWQPTTSCVSVENSKN